MLDENVGSVGVVARHGTPTALEDRVERARRLMQQRKVKGAIIIYNFFPMKLRTLLRALEINLGGKTSRA